MQTLKGEGICVDSKYDQALDHLKYLAWARRMWSPDGTQGSQTPDDESAPLDPVPYILIILKVSMTKSV